MVHATNKVRQFAVHRVCLRLQIVTILYSLLGNEYGPIDSNNYSAHSLASPIMMVQLSAPTCSKKARLNVLLSGPEWSYPVNLEDFRIKLYICTWSVGSSTKHPFTHY